MPGGFKGKFRSAYITQADFLLVVYLTSGTYALCMNEGRQIINATSPASVVTLAAQIICDTAAQAIRERGRFVIVLGGGSTPKQLYQNLASEYSSQLDWPNIHFLFGDERMVPLDDPESNYNMAHATMLGRAPINPANVHAFRTDLPAAQAAMDYEHRLRLLAGDMGDMGNVGDVADVVLLGMGADGHTLSLFPGGETQEWELPGRWCIDAIAPEPFAVRSRVTVTLSFVHRVRLRLFLVASKGKTQALAAVSRGEQLPAGRVRAATWIISP